MPLVFHDRIAQCDRDPNVLASRLAQHYSLLDFGPRPGLERNFLHRSVTAAAGELILTCGYTSPIAGTIGERHGTASINFCCSGSTTYELEGRSLLINPDRPLFFSPGLEYQYSVDHFNGLAFHVDLGRLQSTAATIAGLGASPRRFIADLESPKAISLDGGRRERLIGLLRRAFSLLDDPLLEAAPELHHLGIDDLIHRTLALLLCPGLLELEEPPPRRAGGRAGRERIFEELLEWIRAHLHQPVHLTDLERRTGYSRRHLQQAFQQRFGCGPIQWIRRQRLEQARLALLSGGDADSVGSIARGVGFTNLSVFSRDFSSLYGLRPSELLREARRLSR